MGSSEGVQILRVLFKYFVFILGKVSHKVTLGMDKLQVAACKCSARWDSALGVLQAVPVERELRARVLPASGKC